jgi:hypothetical protein
MQSQQRHLRRLQVNNGSFVQIYFDRKECGDASWLGTLSTHLYKDVKSVLVL